MSTLLQLVNDLERESGTIYQNQRLGSVLNAPGRQEKMVEWVIEAWRQIQTSRTDWSWMRREFSAPLIIGQSRYTAVQLGLTTFSRWVQSSPLFHPYALYDPANGQSEEQPLTEIPFAEWKQRWARGVHDALRPREVSVDYERRLCVGPKPDKIYTLTGEYFRSVQILVADTDVPICPEQHHGTIVWRALMLMAGHDEAPGAAAYAGSEYTKCLRALVDDSFEMAYL